MQNQITSYYLSAAATAKSPPGGRPRLTFMDLLQSVRRCHLQTFESDQDQNERPQRFRTSRYIESDEQLIDCRGCRCNDWEEARRQYRATGHLIMPSLEVGCSCGLDRIPTALFLACRAWSEDAISTFYLDNHFKLYYQGEGWFSVLDTLQSTTLQMLTRLTVRLSMSFCDDGHGCHDPAHGWECHPSCKVIGHDSALRSHSTETNKMSVTGFDFANGWQRRSKQEN